jgi:hypothetical protein
MSSASLTPPGNTRESASILARLESSLVSLLSALGWLLFFGRPAWGTNDDLGIQAIAAGILGVMEPSALVVHAHPSYGLLLRTLHGLSPDTAWHGWLLLVANAASLSLLHAAVLRLRRDRFARVAAALMVVICTSILMAHVQFTITAGLLATAGGVWALSQRARPGHGISVWAPAAVFFMLGTLLREHAAVLALLVLAPAFFIPCYAGRVVQTVRGALLWIGAAALLVSAAHFTARACYRDEAWQGWESLNKTKSIFIDYQLIPWNEQTEPVFAAQGWNRGHYDMIQFWQYQDPAQFPPASFQKVIKGTAQFQRQESGALALTCMKLWERLHGFDLLFPLGGSLLALLLAFARRREVYAMALLLLWALLLVLGIEITLNRVLLRVAAVVIFALVWTALLLCLHGTASKDVRWRAWLALVLVALPLPGFFSYSHAWILHNGQQAGLLRDKMSAWQAKLPPDSIVLDAGGLLPVEYLSPVEDLAPLRAVRGFIGLGWLNQSPHQRASFRQLGLETDFYQQLLRRGHVYLITRPKWDRFREMLGVMHHYMEQHYRLDLQYRTDPALPGLAELVVTPLQPAE